jgi:hypothetical protein
LFVQTFTRLIWRQRSSSAAASTSRIRHISLIRTQQTFPGICLSIFSSVTPLSLIPFGEDAQNISGNTQNVVMLPQSS